MKATLAASTVAACLFGAVALGIWLRRLVPEPHLTTESKDTVKLAMGLVATMSALLLGLLLSSAKSGYDAERKQVIQMAAKVGFLDRVLALYGPESADARAKFEQAIDQTVGTIWPTEKGTPVLLTLDTQTGNGVYIAIQQLSPRDELQRSLKTEALGLAVELGLLRSLLAAESGPSISRSILLVVVCWLVAIFLSFSLLAPSNTTTTLALTVSAFSVAGAFFLILELDEPFGGLLRISSGPMLSALNQIGK